MHKRTAAARLWLAGPILLIALWLPGFDQGFPRVDVGLYAGLSKHAYDADIAQWWFLTGPENDYFNKPPLAFWIHGFFARAVELLGGPSTGERMWVLRFPALIAGIICIVATTRAVRTLSSHRTALIASIVLASSLEFFRYTKALSLDLWLCAFVMLAVSAIAAKRTTPRLAIAGACIGLALLVKPWLALLPLAILIAWSVSLESWRILPNWLAAITAMTLVAAPWHLSMLHQFGSTWTDAYIASQAVARITSDAHGSELPYYYLSALLSWHWPWLIFTALGVSAIITKRFPRDRAAVRLIVLWLVVWFLALTISTDKTTRYMISTMPMLAWLAALWMVKASPLWFARGRARPFVGWAPWAALLIGITIAILGVRVHKPIPPEWTALQTTLTNNPTLAPRLTLAHPDRAAAGTLYWLTNTWPPTLDNANIPNPAILYTRPTESERTQARTIADPIIDQGTLLLIAPD